MNLFSKYASALAIAASIGAFGVAPVQAQGLGFQFNPPGGNFSFDFNVGRPDRPGRCIPARAIDDAIEDQGYRRVRIEDYGRRYTDATGIRSGWLYAITADSCSGRVIDRDRIRRV